MSIRDKHRSCKEYFSELVCPLGASELPQISQSKTHLRHTPIPTACESLGWTQASAWLEAPQLSQCVAKVETRGYRYDASVKAGSELAREEERSRLSELQ